MGLVFGTSKMIYIEFIQTVKLTIILEITHGGKRKAILV